VIAIKVLLSTSVSLRAKLALSDKTRKYVECTQRNKGKKEKNRETKKTVKPRVRQKGWGGSFVRKLKLCSNFPFFDI
jgi:hypothetical protein